MDVQVSDSFKRMTVKAIWSIILFATVYILLIIAVLAFAFFCLYLAFTLITLGISWITVVLSLGIASLGVLLVIFLFKFLFKKNKVNTSHMLEIHRNNHPRLFAMIDDIVAAVETNSPKRVYLTNDVNAAVFYDSSFWSMVFPVRKNLLIGMGLINTLTAEELKAVLAHEFGHFSQRTMKVGSYVYNVNQVIYNMLYENESYNKLLEAWSSISSFFVFFARIVVELVKGIQWILRKMYQLINLNYMGLSREMEFHADEVATHVTGSAPFVSALLRINLSNHSYNMSLNYYDKRIGDCVVSPNLYPEQSFIMHLLAKESDLKYHHALPVVTLPDLNRYNKSKLNIKDQWSSHPSTEDRIAAIQKLNIEQRQTDDQMAIQLFEDPEALQQQLTQIVFEKVEYVEQPRTLPLEEFKSAFMQAYEKENLDKRYNHYYDDLLPLVFDIESIDPAAYDELTLESLYSDEKVDMVYDLIGLLNDQATLEAIVRKEYDVYTFDYDGVKYKASDAPEVLKQVEQSLQIARERVVENDRKIYAFFYQQAALSAQQDALRQSYETFFEFRNSYEERYGFYTGMFKELEFVRETTPFEQIHSKLNHFRGTSELRLKREIKEFKEHPLLQEFIDQEAETLLSSYLESTLIYFSNNEYHNEELQKLFSVMEYYGFFLTKLNYLIFKKLLDDQIGTLPAY